MKNLEKQFEKEHPGWSALHAYGATDEFTKWLKKQIEELANLVRIQPERDPKTWSAMREVAMEKYLPETTSGRPVQAPKDPPRYPEDRPVA